MGVRRVFDGPERAPQAAVAIREAARELGLEIRAGVHMGHVKVEAPGPGARISFPHVFQLTASAGFPMG